MRALIIPFVAIVVITGIGFNDLNNRVAESRALAIESKQLICEHLDMVASNMNRRLRHEECLKVGVDLL